MRPRRDEQGAALLTVLLLVAVIGVIAAASLERLKLQTHLSGNMAAIDQARHYALAGEAIARTRISDVSSPDRTMTLAGDWLDRPNPFPIDNGTATAKLSDAGNCFNLNSLVSQSAEGDRVVRPVAVRQFEALMTIIGIQPRTAGLIAQSAADWIDSDTVPEPGGAEDETYARAPTPYRAANVLMSRALAPIDMLVGTWRGFIGARSAFRRLEALLAAHPERDPALSRVARIRRTT